MGIPTGVESVGLMSSVPNSGTLGSPHGKAEPVVGADSEQTNHPGAQNEGGPKSKNVSILDVYSTDPGVPIPG